MKKFRSNKTILWSEYGDIPIMQAIIYILQSLTHSHKYEILHLVNLITKIFS